MSHVEGIDHLVEFHGMLSPNQVGGLYSKSHVFVLPSLFEGRPNVVVEAMAAGCSVLVSDINGNNELINHDENGLVFSVGNQNQLARQIEKVVSDADLRIRLGQAARKYVVDNRLSWDGCASGYYGVFRMLLEQRN